MKKKYIPQLPEFLLTFTIYFVTGTYSILHVMDLNSSMHYNKSQRACKYVTI